ncbi:flagellar biosynthesis protein FlhA [Methylopila turkensis]|uniref:Flagellar biosynthesis protein FlhA n=1 Tax=Methylopila turkensis TaxID=1437816 RepID=A0A9W6JMT5_9HYPH|nr:flagellar biosynthesis protein FlhA [Methylopila turkensis]GLK78574.1 flagellar biosynthesis protein FlhA [Methylopila turkensis]
MSDVTVTGRGPTPVPTTASSSGGVALPAPLAKAWNILRRGDLGLALGVLVILCVLIVPLPPLLLDLLLAISITLSVLILMTALFIEKPLEFSAFPTVLLVATMLRLALNLASTRLILGHGHEGPDAAGHVIEAFGSFVMGGNFVIGVIVFSILVIVNFIVITKGSGRIAEVAARFTLDAMPGKQMAIDADLSAGLIDEATAKTRRKELEDESTFFGAMDGASKFVRGDAIAGILILFITIIGGMIVGIAQNGLGFAEAARSYTLLSIGDGLVSQIPALIVSTAAGLLVSKAGVSGSADRALVRQLSGYPKALGLAAAVIGVMALLPGIPFIPFMGLAAGAGYMAYRSSRTRDVAEAERVAQIVGAGPAAAAEAAAAAAAEDPASALRMDDVKIELGYALLPLVDSKDGPDKLTEQIKALRRTMAGEVGFLLPQVRLLDNLQLAPNAYVVKVKEVEAGGGSVYPNQFMVMDPSGQQVRLPGVHTVEPTFGLPATWIDASLREEANILGYTVVDATTVLSTHLNEIVRANMPDLLSYGEVTKLLKELPKEQQKLVEDITPAQISTTGIQRVLQLLLTERVSIRDLGTILEGVAEAVSFTRAPAQIVEHVRTRLGRQLCAQHQAMGGYVPLVTLSPQWEQAFAESIVGTGEDKTLAMAPSKLHEFIAAVRDRFEEAARQGETPVLLTSAAARPFVRSIVERFRNQTPVMSQNEIHPRARLKTVASV